MKTNLFFILLIIFTSCKSKMTNPTELKDCISTSPKWSMVSFNEDFNIGVPDKYKGENYLAAKTFFVRGIPDKNDISIRGGEYCPNGLFNCKPESYNKLISFKQVPDSIKVYNFGNLYFKNKTVFCQNNEIIAIFFWGTINGTTPEYKEEFGELYLKPQNSDSFQLAGYLDYLKKYHDEVIEILSTLTPVK